MSIFKPNHKNIQFEDNGGGRTPVKFSSKEKKDIRLEKKAKRKKIRRISLFIITIGVLASLSVFGIKAWNSVRDVFEGDANILNLLTGQSGQLKGESEGRTNILLMGIGGEDHQGGNLADSIILASVDYRSKYVAFFSIPRDLYVKIPSDGFSKINAAHAYGERDNPGEGPQLMKRTVEASFGVPIHYYARVDFDGLQKMVDALGGVTINVENAFCDYNYPTQRKGDTRKICFKEGSQNMNGVKALQYSRSRHALGVEGSDFARSRRQQNLILAIKEKALSANTAFNPKKVLDVLAVLGDNIKTDFQVQDFARLYELSKEVDASKVISKNFDNSPEGMLVSSSSTQAGYILRPVDNDFDEIKEVVENIFSVVYMREEKARVELENGGYNVTKFTNLSESMKKEGFNIVNFSSKVSKAATKTQIIDYTNGKKPETIKALEERFGVTALKSSNGEEGDEIKIIVGQYYKG